MSDNICLLNITPQCCETDEISAFMIYHENNPVEYNMEIQSHRDIEILSL